MSGCTGLIRADGTGWLRKQGAVSTLSCVVPGPAAGAVRKAARRLRFPIAPCR